jgi:hypothetical protein
MVRGGRIWPVPVTLCCNRMVHEASDPDLKRVSWIVQIEYVSHTIIFYIKRVVRKKGASQPGFRIAFSVHLAHSYFILQFYTLCSIFL